MNPQTHWQRYGRAYLIGFVFFVVTVGTAFVSEFENMTAAQEAAMTRIQWAVAFMSVAVQAGTNLLAFLNQSAAKQPTTTPPPPAP
jgi:hypothetical protein